MPSISDVKKDLLSKARMFKSVFSSIEGEQVLEALEREFDSDQIHVPGDPYSTHYNLGRRDVIIYIRQIMRYGNE